MDIKRQPTYFETDAGTLFGWLHTSTEVPVKECAVVICPPLGYAYMTTHRILRHLADEFARCGFPTIRFDYSATGDSGGEAFVADQINLCSQNIISVCQQAKAISGCAQVCCAGFGLGASFAMISASLTQIDYLVLWEPAIKGRRFVRELKGLSGVLNKSDNAESNEIPEAVGLFLTEFFERELNQLDLLGVVPAQTSAVLLSCNEESTLTDKFESHLEQAGIAHKKILYSGYEDMLILASETIVPVEAIATQVNWLAGQVTSICAETKPLDSDKFPTGKKLSGYCPGFDNENVDIVNKKYEEQWLQFGEHNELFGVLSVGCNPSKPASTMVVFLNCGTEHHVGPHRMYTDFSRRLVALGYACFRMDIIGVGDSVVVEGEKENESYPAGAIENIRLALADLKQLTGCNEFVLTGICAGAYHSFKACADIDEFNIRVAILANPLVFHWQETEAEKSKTNVDQMNEAKRYKSIVFKWSSWKKLFGGGVNITYISQLMVARLKAIVLSTFSVTASEKSKNVTASLLRIRKLKRKLFIVQAEDDFGYKILMTDAKKEANKAIKQGDITIQFIDSADHGLTKYRMREDLFAIMSQRLQEL